MARAVFLYFEDNDEAENYVKHIDERYAFQVIGLYGVPTQFCDCPKVPQGKTIKRGAKLGWWVHPECGKPVKGSYQSPRNLIDPKWDPREDTVVMFNYTVALKHHMGQRPDV